MSREYLVFESVNTFLIESLTFKEGYLVIKALWSNNLLILNIGITFRKFQYLQSKINSSILPSALKAQQSLDIIIIDVVERYVDLVIVRDAAHAVLQNKWLFSPHLSGIDAWD